MNMDTRWILFNLMGFQCVTWKSVLLCFRTICRFSLMNLFCASQLYRALLRHCRVINSSTAAQFSAAFDQSILSGVFSSVDHDVEALAACFDSVCLSVLDCVAPVKARQTKPRSEPWLNESTRAARRECRRAERRWKKRSMASVLSNVKD